MRNPNLTAWAKLQGIEGQDLNEDVHELMADKAIAINNGGMDGQLEFLSQEMGGEEAVKKHLRALYNIAKDAECPSIDILDGQPVPFALTVQKAGESVEDAWKHMDEVDQWLSDHGKVRMKVEGAYVFYDQRA